MLFYAFIGSGPQFVTFCEVARRLKVRPRWEGQSQTRRRGCHCWELQDELFAFCGRTVSACMDLLNRVFSTHLIGFLLRATEQERKSALKRLRYYVAQMVWCGTAQLHFAVKHASLLFDESLFFPDICCSAKMSIAKANKPCCA